LQGLKRRNDVDIARGSNNVQAFPNT
jgi:hypothetical protein